jgi:RimJ/RimL family protein N-acetyltransferase
MIPDVEPRIETERLVLRKPRADDVPAMLAYYSDPVAMEFIAEPTDDPAVAAEAVERWLGRWRVDGFGYFTIDRKSDGAAVGRIGLLVWDTRIWQSSTLAETGEHGQVELGWSLARAHWGNGYATEAAGAVRDWANAQGLTSLISLIHPQNERSIRVALRLGAEPTETIAVGGKPAVVWRHPVRLP